MRRVIPILGPVGIALVVVSIGAYKYINRPVFGTSFGLLGGTGFMEWSVIPARSTGRGLVLRDDELQTIAIIEMPPSASASVGFRSMAGGLQFTRGSNVVVIFPKLAGKLYYVSEDGNIFARNLPPSEWVTLSATNISGDKFQSIFNSVKGAQRNALKSQSLYNGNGATRASARPSTGK